MPSPNFIPLKWPAAFKKTTKLQKFLMWTPLVGFQRKAAKMVCEQLKRRDVSYIYLWGNSKEILQLAQSIGAQSNNCTH